MKSESAIPNSSLVEKDSMYQFQFKPILKQYRWGGRKLGTSLNKPIGTDSDYAESWEMVDHLDDQSEVSTGLFQGQTLRELISNNPDDILGKSSIEKQFPLLIKFLDCNDRLSVQVHPNDEQAGDYQLGENGKTEAWVILDSAPNSVIYVGLKDHVTKESLLNAIESGDVEESLHKIHPNVGDCFVIPAGTVHALGEGILVAEVQQSSDLTFRLHDWDRLDLDGNPRQLHIKEAMECIDFEANPIEPVDAPTQKLGTALHRDFVECSHFGIREWETSTSFSIPVTDRFHVIMLSEGKAQFQCDDSEPVDLVMGETTLISACTKTLKIIPDSQVKFLDVTDGRGFDSLG